MAGFLLDFFLTVSQGSLLWGQPLEEQEELQTRPNPIEKTVLKNRTGISEKGSVPVKRNSYGRKRSSPETPQVPRPGQSLQKKVGVSGKRGLLNPNGLVELPAPNDSATGINIPGSESSSLTISGGDDNYEQEADTVADQVNPSHGNSTNLLAPGNKAGRNLIIILPGQSQAGYPPGVQ